MLELKFKDNFQAVTAAEKRAVAMALEKIGVAAREHARENIDKQDIWETGDLWRSMDYISSENAVAIGTEQNYGIFHELGTTEVEARPFLSPAITDNAGQYEKIAGKELGKELNSEASGKLTTRSKYYEDDDRVDNL